MNGIINVIVKADEFDNPHIRKIDSIIAECIRDCHHNYFLTFEPTCVNDIKLTNKRNIEIVNLTIDGKSMDSYGLNKKLTVARQNGFRYNQINKLTIKIYSNLFYTNLRYYLKHRIPMCPIKILMKNSQI